MGNKAQSAIEFIMTYSWVFIIIALFIVTVVLISDARPPTVYLGSSCSIQPLLPCTEALITYNSVTPVEYFIVFTNELGTTMYFPPNSINLSTSSIGGNPNYQYGNCQPTYASKGSSIICSANILTATKPKSGSESQLSFTLSYSLCSSGTKSSCSPGIYKSTGFSTETVSPSTVTLNNVTFLTVPSTATIILNGVTYYNGISTYLPTGNYVLFSTAPHGYSTLTWSIASPSSVLSSTTSPNTILTLTSNALVTAAYVAVTTSSSTSTSSTSSSVSSTSSTSSSMTTTSTSSSTTSTISVTFSSGMSASIVIGQANANSGSPNQGGSTAANSLANPYSTAFDSSGDLWVSDLSNDRILEFKPPFSTNEVASVVIGQTCFTCFGVSSPTPTTFDTPTGIAFDSHGDLWVVDTGDQRVLKFLPANLVTGGAAAVVLGQTSLTAAQPGSLSSTTFWNPWSLAFDPSGDLWVADITNNRVLEFLPANLVTGGAAAAVLGQTSLIYGLSGDSANTLSSPYSVAFDSHGNLWVADQGNNRVLEFPTANLVTNGHAAIVLGATCLSCYDEGTTANFLNEPLGVTFDPSGNLWVIDADNSRVLEFLPANLVTNGQAGLVLGQTNFVSGLSNQGGSITASTLSIPTAADADSSGDIWVVDTSNSRVLEYT